MKFNTLNLILIAVLTFAASPAYAYIDPGSGSMILQGVVLAFVAGWFTVKNYWVRIISLFRGHPKDDAASELPSDSKSSD